MGHQLRARGMGTFRFPKLHRAVSKECLETVGFRGAGQRVANRLTTVCRSAGRRAARRVFACVCGSIQSVGTEERVRGGRALRNLAALIFVGFLVPTPSAEEIRFRLPCRSIRRPSSDPSIIKPLGDSRRGGLPERRAPGTAVAPRVCDAGTSRSTARIRWTVTVMALLIWGGG